MPAHTLKHGNLYNFSFKSVSASGHFSGYASVFGVVDQQRDLVKRGAFERSITGRTQSVKLLWQHRMDEPVGVITRLYEDRRGLYVEGQLMLASTRGREAYAMLKSGLVTGLSIGYRPRAFHEDTASGTRVLEEVDLYEISFVTFPANAAARVAWVKGMGV